MNATIPHKARARNINRSLETLGIFDIFSNESQIQDSHGKAGKELGISGENWKQTQGLQIADHHLLSMVTGFGATTESGT